MGASMHVEIAHLINVTIKNSEREKKVAETQPARDGNTDKLKDVYV